MFPEILLHLVFEPWNNGNHIISDQYLFKCLNWSAAIGRIFLSPSKKAFQEAICSPCHWNQSEMCVFSHCARNWYLLFFFPLASPLLFLMVVIRNNPLRASLEQEGHVFSIPWQRFPKRDDLSSALLCNLSYWPLPQCTLELIPPLLAFNAKSKGNFWYWESKSNYRVYWQSKSLVHHCAQDQNVVSCYCWMLLIKCLLPLSQTRNYFCWCLDGEPVTLLTAWQGSWADWSFLTRPCSGPSPSFSTSEKAIFMYQHLKCLLIKQLREHGLCRQHGFASLSRSINLSGWLLPPDGSFPARLLWEGASQTEASVSACRLSEVFPLIQGFVTWN